MLDGGDDLYFSISFLHLFEVDENSKVNEANMCGVVAIGSSIPFFLCCALQLVSASCLKVAYFLMLDFLCLIM